MLLTMIARPSIGLLVTQAMEHRLRRALPSVRFSTVKDWLELVFLDLESPIITSCASITRMDGKGFARC